MTILDRLAWAPAADDRPGRGLVHLHTETTVPASVGATFGFFSDASNLERLTPAWLNFRIRTARPIEMREGTEIEYRIRLHGVPIRWISRIDVWEPGVCFVDRQIIGPYRWWRHEHRFEATSEGSRVIDHVEFVPRWRWASTRLVQRDVRRIFTHRQQVLPQLFGSPSAPSGRHGT